jgi:hypothetical protein
MAPPRAAADDSPAVQGAQAQAAGSRKDARAAHADLLPRVSAGMDAGRYGVFENDQNYDVRARVSLNYRFSFGASAHAHQADARASAALARADRVREEAARDAAIARSDLDALNEQIAALRASYIAARRSRDVLAERFRVSRGDLFDVMASNTAMFDAAAAYIEALAARCGSLCFAFPHGPPAARAGACFCHGTDHSMTREIEIAPARPRFAPWLVQPMLANKAIYLKVALAAAMINLFGLGSSLFSMTVYDRVVPNNATSSLIGLSIGLGIVVVFDFILRSLRSYFVDMAGMDIDRKLGGAAFARLLALRLDLRKGSTGSLAAMMRELETLRDFFASATLTALVDVPLLRSPWW